VWEEGVLLMDEYDMSEAESYYIDTQGEDCADYFEHCILRVYPWVITEKEMVNDWRYLWHIRVPHDKSPEVETNLEILCYNTQRDIFFRLSTLVAYVIEREDDDDEEQAT
jgi:hypothetical protein